MAIAFRQLIIPWANNSPAASDAFTGTAGDTVLIVGGDYSNDITAFSGTGGTYDLLTPPGDVEDVDFNHNWAIGDCLSIAGGSQTTTLIGTSGDGLTGVGIVFSGGVSAVSGNGNTVAAPGTADNAIKGTEVSVPEGSVLCSCAIDTTENTSAVITSSGTTPPGGSGTGNLNTAWCFGYYAGPGEITPEFTTTVGTDNYIVVQWLLTPASSGDSGSAAAAEGADTVSGTGAVAIPGSGAITARRGSNHRVALPQTHSDSPMRKISNFKIDFDICDRQVVMTLPQSCKSISLEPAFARKIAAALVRLADQLEPSKQEGERLH